MRSVKTTGIICMALLLTAIAGASTASAAQFRAEKYPATATGGLNGGIYNFTTSGPSWKCVSSTLTGTISAPSTTFAAVPAFSNCQFGGFSFATKLNSCSFAFQNSGEEGVNTGTMDVVCSKGGDQIELINVICTLKIPAQTGRGPVEYANVGGPGSSRKFTVAANTTGFKYSLAGFGGMGCGVPDGTYENGTLGANWIVQGSSGGSAVGVYLSNTQ